MECKYSSYFSVIEGEGGQINSKFERSIKQIQFIVVIHYILLKREIIISYFNINFFYFNALCSTSQFDY